MIEQPAAGHGIDDDNLVDGLKYIELPDGNAHADHVVDDSLDYNAICLKLFYRTLGTLSEVSYNGY